jgi:pyruvate carboxylase
LEFRTENMSLSHPISTLLIANRGEIAQRIIQTARELSITTYALYTTDDYTHATHAHHALPLPGPEAYMDIDCIIDLCLQHNIQAIHPGYGFLSESSIFAAHAEARGIKVIGPGATILAQTGDKLEARRLAEVNGVPTLSALTSPTRSLTQLQSFASTSGYPLMIKAVDGGGGRGIRLVESEESLASNLTRAIEESPSKLVFAEKAAVIGFLHVEIQVLGDGSEVRHLWERQCSIQRRYQKVVEVAPCISAPRPFIREIVDCAVKMAKSASHRLQRLDRC